MCYNSYSGYKHPILIKMTQMKSTKLFDFLASFMDYISIAYFMLLLFLGGRIDFTNLTIVFLLIFFRVISMSLEVYKIYTSNNN